MKLAFDFLCDEALLFSGIALQLKQEGHDIYGFTMGCRWNQGWHKEFITSPVCDLKIAKMSNIDKELERIGGEYKDYHPGAFLQTDRFLMNNNRDYQRKILVHTFLSVEKCIDSWGPDFYFSTGVAYLYNLVTLAVCGKRGIPHISLYSTRGVKPRFTVSFGVGGSWDLVEKQYTKFRDGEPCSQDEMEEAEGALAEFKNRAGTPFYMNLARQSSLLKVVFIKEFISRCKNWYLDGWGGEKDDYITQNPFWYVGRDLKKLVLAAYIKKKRHVIFDKVNRGDNYYIFPLHLQPEASTLVLAPWYVNQITTIENISKSLPLNCFLYVKEHRSALGRHNLSFYKKIQSLHNVKLVAYDEDTPNLIANSKGVIVLSSTMGWESLLLGKPVYLLGDVFYKVVDGVFWVDNYLRLQNILEQHLEVKGDTITSIDQQSVKQFMVAVKRFSYPGLFDVHKLDLTDKVLAKENVRHVKEGVMSIMAACLDKAEVS